jgi:hypothetical protein
MSWQLKELTAYPIEEKDKMTMDKNRKCSWRG